MLIFAICRGNDFFPPPDVFILNSLNDGGELLIAIARGVDYLMWQILCRVVPGDDVDGFLVRRWRYTSIIGVARLLASLDANAWAAH